MKRVIVYNGKGVSNMSMRWLHGRLKRFLVSVDVVSVDAEAIISGEALAKDTVAIVFPGGHSRFFQQHLGSAGNERIREFVRNGGRYFGICGGAYYAASEIEFTGKELEFPKRSGNLALFQGEAIGSLPELTRGLYFTDEYDTANVVRIGYLLNTSKNTDVNSREVKSYYHGGPKFLPNGIQPFEILGKYADCLEDIAAVKVPYGLGCAVLVGIHPELYSGFFLKDQISKFLNQQNFELLEHLQRMFEQLSNIKNQEKGRNYFRFLLNKLFE
ncbi:MAG: hypothetical protein LBE20_03165 [Deltaproteobacteria bacterium]|nr:hypothetical protein [Deltaproteobacteria bacterium]